MAYTSWPLGKLPKEFQRPEPDLIKEAGYTWDDPRDIIEIFEQKVADFAGSKYAVAVDCCSHGLFLCLQYMKHKYRMGLLPGYDRITIPKHTYISVPMQILHAGFIPEFEHLEWSGVYQLKPFPVWDAAVRWTKGMYDNGLGLGNGFWVTSFQLKKRVPIGRGGIILFDEPEAYDFLKKISYDGRDLTVPYDEDAFSRIGWHYYMTPEDAARGILLMDQVPKINNDSADWTNYTDISEVRMWKNLKLL